MKPYHKTVGLFTSFAAIIIALMGILGYLPGWRVLASLNTDYIPMAPSTSVSFIIISIVVIFIYTNKIRGINQVLFIFLISLVTIFGLLDIIGHFVKLDLNLEDTIIPYYGELKGIPVARMSPATGTTFLLSGISVLLLIIEKKTVNGNKYLEYLNGWIIISILITGFVFCLAYVYGQPLLYDYNNTIPMALTTALGFLLIAFSMLFYRQNSFPFRLLTEASTFSFLLRYMLPLAIISVLAGGIISYFSKQIAIINPAIISAVLTILVIIVAGLLSTWISQHLGKIIDHQNDLINRSKQELQKNLNFSKELINSMTDGFALLDEKGVHVDVNPAFCRMTGFNKEELIGAGIPYPHRPDAEYDSINKAFLLSLKGSHQYFELIFKKKNGERFPVIVSPSQITDHKGEIIGNFATIKDISDFKEVEKELLKLKKNLEAEVQQKTKELRERIDELERFHDATIDREIRMEELRDEIELLKQNQSKK